jgi:transmembrane sensor
LIKPSSKGYSKRIGQLILKYLAKDITIKESIELARWTCRSRKNIKLFKKLREPEFFKAIINSDSEKIEKELEELFSASSSTSVNKKAPVIVCALMIFLLILISYITNYRTNAEGKRILETSQSSAPGIFLTLLDGTTIDIDSVNSPIRQGNILLTKNGNEISYIPIPNYNPQSEEYNTIRTMFGKQIKVVFLDGSKVWLNAGSSIQYPTSFNKKFRKVNITGEAFFEIAPIIDSTLSGNRVPFLVNANGVEILVKGTKFNVQSYETENEIKTSLFEGCIEVKKGNQAYLLEPGNQAIFSYDTFKIIKDFESEEVLAWKNDMFVFHDLEFWPLMHQIARWYNVTVVDDGKNLISDRFTLSVPRSLPLEQLLGILQSTSTVHFKIENHTVFVSK